MKNRIDLKDFKIRTDLIIDESLENQALKNEVRNLKSSIEAAKIGDKEITNVDLLRRVSQLEKIILGKSQQ